MQRRSTRGLTRRRRICATIRRWDVLEAFPLTCPITSREIDSIDALDATDQAARNIAGIGANVEDGARFVRDKIGQDVKDLRRIGQPQRIELDDASILEPSGVLGCKMSWSRQHIDCKRKRSAH